MIVGNYLKRHRTRKGMSQMDVAKQFNFTTAQFISNLERGISPVPKDMIIPLSKLLKFNVDEFLRVRLRQDMQELRWKSGLK